MTVFLIFLLMLAQTPMDKEYTAKRGDAITVTVWERESLSGTVFVDSNGNITLPMPIGSIQVLGLSSGKITQILTDKLKEYLVSPTVFVSISPAEGLTIHVLGEILAPNFIKVPEGTTLQEAISRAGGFTEYADKKNIRLIHYEENITDGSKKSIETTIDFERFIEQSDLSYNPVLNANDVIIVPRLTKQEEKKYITFFGAVNKPGVIESEVPLSLMKAIALAGGVSTSASIKDIYIITETDKGISRKQIDFEKFINEGDKNSNPIISLGDVVLVPTKPEEEPPFSINVFGQVKTPGKYPAIKSSRVFDAIAQAGGFAEDADIDNISIIRSSAEGVAKQSINIKEYIATGNIEYNPLLVNGDTIFVPISQDAKLIPSIHQTYLNTIRISVIGEVSKPGIYLVSANSNVLDVLKLAEGYTGFADLKKVTIIRQDESSNEKLQRFNLQKILTSGKIDSLPNLRTGDTVFVPRKPEETLWRTFVRSVSEMSTILTAIYLIAGLR